MLLGSSILNLPADTCLQVEISTGVSGHAQLLPWSWQTPSSPTPFEFPKSIQLANRNKRKLIRGLWIKEAFCLVITPIIYLLYTLIIHQLDARHICKTEQGGLYSAVTRDSLHQSLESDETCKNELFDSGARRMHDFLPASFVIECETGRRWTDTYKTASFEIASAWLSNHVIKRVPTLIKVLCMPLCSRIFPILLPWLHKTLVRTLCVALARDRNTLDHENS